jgi:hypothetical protein
MLFETIYAKTHDKTPEELFPEAEQAYKYVLEDQAFENEHGQPIEFTNRGKRELFWSIDQVMQGNIGKGATRPLSQNEDILDEVLAIVEKLGDVTEEARYKFKQENKKPEQKPLVKGYEFYDCPVVVDGERRNVRIAVEVEKDGTRQFYYCFITNNY